MFMIVVGHCLNHGGVAAALTDTFSLNYVLDRTIRAFLYVHVNCFVLISGYFLCTSRFKWSKWIEIWVQTFFWSVLLYLLTAFLWGEPFVFSISGLVKACLPFTQQGYWFVTSYLLMYLLSPVCNYAIQAMDQRKHLTSIVVFFAVFIVLQNLVFWREFTSVGAHDPLFFVFLYFIAAYFRLYPPKKKHPWLLGYVLSCGFVALWTTINPIITTKLFGDALGDTAFSGYNSIMLVIGSVCFFMSFVQADIRGWIARMAVAISPLTFGIYLIHDNTQIRTLLWDVLIQPDQYANNPWMLVIVIGISVAVFVVCAGLEWLRQKMFWVLYINKLYEGISGCISRLTENAIEKITRL